MDGWISGQKCLTYYTYAYFVYNISMSVNIIKPPLEIIRELLKNQNGRLLTSDLVPYGISRTYLSMLEKRGEIQRISMGVYSTTNILIDEMAGLQARFRSAIFSHETALYFLELTDRTPLFYSVTVPSGYNATSLKVSGAKVYFVKRDLYHLGLTTKKSPNGNDIQTFNLERTICDLLRSRNQIDVQFINVALKRYVKNSEKNIDLLFSYAGQFRLQKIARNYIEVLL